MNELPLPPWAWPGSRHAAVSWGCLPERSPLLWNLENYLQNTNTHDDFTFHPEQRGDEIKKKKAKNLRGGEEERQAEEQSFYLLSRLTRGSTALSLLLEAASGSQFLYLSTEEGHTQDISVSRLNMLWLHLFTGFQHSFCKRINWLCSKKRGWWAGIIRTHYPFYNVSIYWPSAVLQHSSTEACVAHIDRYTEMISLD